MGIFRRFVGFLADASNHATADGMFSVHFKDAVSTFDRMTQEANSYHDVTPRGFTSAPKQSKTSPRTPSAAVNTITIPIARQTRQNNAPSTHFITITRLPKPMSSQPTTYSQGLLDGDTSSKLSNTKTRSQDAD